MQEQEEKAKDDHIVWNGYTLALIRQYQKELGLAEAQKRVHYFLSQKFPQDVRLSDLLRFSQRAPGMRGLEALGALMNHCGWTSSEFQRKMNEIIAAADKRRKKSTISPSRLRGFVGMPMPDYPIDQDGPPPVIQDLPELIYKAIELEKQEDK